MQLTAKELKQYLADVPDDAKVWIEYPTRSGIAQPPKLITKWEGSEHEADFIECMSFGSDRDKTAVYIFHHY